MGRHLLRTTTERRDLESGVDEIEGRRLELACKEVVLHEYYVGEALGIHELSRGLEHRVVDVGPHDLSVRPDPLAQQPQPPDRTAADVEDTRSSTVPNLVQKATTTRLPYARLELKPFKLRGLIRQEVRLRGHLRAHFPNGWHTLEPRLSVTPLTN